MTCIFHWLWLIIYLLLILVIHRDGRKDNHKERERCNSKRWANEKTKETSIWFVFTSHLYFTSFCIIVNVLAIIYLHYSVLQILICVDFKLCFLLQSSSSSSQQHSYVVRLHYNQAVQNKHTNQSTSYGIYFHHC